MVEVRRALRTLIATGLALAAAACSSDRPTSKAPGASGPVTEATLPRDLPPGAGRGVYKVGEPYQINGIWYYPTEDYSYDETGVASWYGPDFNGKYTANGEVYDMNDLTAAHRTLPMPCFVRVTNLDNGRGIILRVNDRGPYARGRIIDVSRRGAQLLGFDGVGTAHVRVTIMPEESKQLAAAMKSGGFYSLAANGPPAIEGQQVAALAPPPLAATRSDVQAEPPAPIAAQPSNTPPPAQIAALEATPPGPPPSGQGGTLAAPPNAPIDSAISALPPTAPAKPPAAPAHPSPPVATLQPPPVAATPPAQPQASKPPATPPGGGHYLTPPPAGAAPVKPGAAIDAGLLKGPTGHLTQGKPLATKLYVQAGAFANVETAKRVSAKLGGIGPVQVSPTKVGGVQLYRVRIGPLKSVGDGDRALDKVVAAGHPQAKLVAD